MPLFLFCHHGTNVGNQVFVRRALAEQRPKIVIFLAEKAGPQLAVRGQPDSRAVSAEGLRDRGNQADFAGGAIREAVLPRGLTAVVRDLLQRPSRVDTSPNFRRRNHQATRRGWRAPARDDVRLPAMRQ